MSEPKTDPRWHCPRCRDWSMPWRSYPSAESVRELGRGIRLHYEAVHPDVEVGK